MGNPACLSTGRNADTLWAKILPMLEEQDMLGTALQLCCQKHPDTVTEVSSCLQAVSKSSGDRVVLVARAHRAYNLPVAA